MYIKIKNYLLISYIRINHEEDYGIFFFCDFTIKRIYINILKLIVEKICTFNFGTNYYCY